MCKISCLQRSVKNKNIFNDTIAAISTPIGEGGIGIVRLSGPLSFKIADEIFQGGHTKEKPSQFASYTTHYGYILNGGTKIDEVILTVMRAPRTYTREDVVEINCHGGIVPLRKVLELVIKKGARLAQPGEFTKRAFLNGRIDLAQAEAVIDIIRARTDLSLKAAMEQLRGGLSTSIRKIREKLFNILSHIEASIDFPEEEIEEITEEKFKKELGLAKTELEDLQASFNKGKILKKGAVVVITGRSNVGKSSLMNAMLGEERSIVTPLPGTTRDTIEEGIEIDGAYIRIVDTAGLSLPGEKNLDPVEIEGIKRARKVLECADLLLVVIDGSETLKKEDINLLKKIKDRNAIIVINKIDLPQRITPAEVKRFAKCSILEISAKKKINILKVKEEISNMIWGGKIEFAGENILTSIRHKELISAALSSLDRAIKPGLNFPELVALDIREAINTLGEITGETIKEEILDRIFENFCIGK